VSFSISLPVARGWQSASWPYPRVVQLPSLAASVNTANRSASTASSMTSSGDGAGPASSGRRVKLDLAGVYPPIATPFDNNENVDYNKLGFNLQRWNDIPFRGTNDLAVSDSL